jgi:anti-anti-sigma regulatory factor
VIALSVDRIGDVAIVECEGTITQNKIGCKLRDLVASLEKTPIIVLDLSEVTLIEGTGLSVFLFLQQWAHQHQVRLKLFNPRWWVREKLERASPIPAFEILTLHELTIILANAEGRFAEAA